MARLTSRLFGGDTRLEACLVDDRAHIVQGDTGFFVSKVQFAVLSLDGGFISVAEIEGMRYGPTSAKCVLAYKVKRRIINTSYQAAADSIVGKMTIASLDAEIRVNELQEFPSPLALGAR